MGIFYNDFAKSQELFTHNAFFKDVLQSLNFGIGLTLAI